MAKTFVLTAQVKTNALFLPLLLRGISRKHSPPRLPRMWLFSNPTTRGDLKMTDPYCSSCHELLTGNRHEHFYNRPLCDDCLFDAQETEEPND
jgi:hypothetical protein